MPEPKPNAREALIKSGMIKAPAVPDGQPPANPPPITPPPDGAPPADPPALPKFELRTPPVPPAEPEGLPPESTDATLPQGAQKAIRQMREHIRRLENQVKQGGNTDEVTAALRMQLEQAHDTIAELDLVRDPRFVAAYEQPKKQILANMGVILEQFGAEKTIVDQLVGKTMAEQIAILRSEAPDSLGAMVSLLQELDKNESARAARLANKSKTKEDLAVWQTQQDTERINMTFETVFQQAAESGDELFREVPGNEAFNANVGKLKQYARHLANDRSELNIARLCQQAAGGQVYADLYRASEARNKAMESQLRAMGAALPRSGGSSGTPPPTTERGKPRTAEDVAAAAAAKLR